MRLLSFKLFLLIIYLLSPTIANADQKLDIKNLIIHKDPKKVDNISFKNSEDILFSLEDFKEDLVILNFWATWCAPCIKELPYFEVLDRREDVEVLLVSLDFPKHKESRLLPFIKKNKLQSKVVLLDDADENYWIKHRLKILKITQLYFLRYCI